MLEAVQTVYSKYATFEGRASRSEYWFFTLFFIIMYVVLAGLAAGTDAGIFGLVALLFILGSIIPSIAVTVRRLHDTGKPGAWYFISFVPIIGGIWLLVLMCTDSDQGPNQYGTLDGSPANIASPPQPQPTSHLPQGTPPATPPQQNNGPFV